MHCKKIKNYGINRYYHSHLAFWELHLINPVDRRLFVEYCNKLILMVCSGYSFPFLTFARKSSF